MPGGRVHCGCCKATTLINALKYTIHCSIEDIFRSSRDFVCSASANIGSGAPRR